MQIAGFTCAIWSWWKSPDVREKHPWPLLIRLIEWCQMELIVPFWSRDPLAFGITITWVFKKIVLANRSCIVLPKIDKWKGHWACSMRELSRENVFEMRFLTRQVWQGTMKKLRFQMFPMTCHRWKQAQNSEGSRPLVKFLSLLHFWWGKEHSGEILFILTLLFEVF